MHIFDFDTFVTNPQTLTKCLKPSPEQHFHFAHAMTAFKMLLWLMAFGETLTQTKEVMVERVINKLLSNAVSGLLKVEKNA